MRTTNTHIYFWGDIFSNFFLTKFIYKGIEFNTTEKAFMWEKANFFKDQNSADKIMNTMLPKDAKALGRFVINFDADKWNTVREDFMYEVNMCKFFQNVGLMDRLLATRSKIIVEASPVDFAWGVGFHELDDRILDEKNWKGLNLLGKTLMKVRDTLNNKQEQVKDNGN